MSSEMFSAVHETQTVTCLVQVQLVNGFTRPDTDSETVPHGRTLTAKLRSA